MRKSLYSLFILITAIIVTSCAEKESTAEQLVTKTPVKETESTPSVSIGKYTAGCVKNSVQLPVSGPGYQVVRLHRGRYFGNSVLVDFIRDLSYSLNRQYGTTLYIADISQKGGGPILDDHSSHQTGLDADILYIHKPLKENGYVSAEAREKKHPVSTLNSNGKEVDPDKWSPVNEQILKHASQYGKVDRIFVNPAIKEELCNKYPGSEWLRKLRPWWGHDGHFHVRMECPVNSIKCKPSSPIPDGTGCGSDLAWWFSEDARLKRIEISKAPQKTEEDINLPEECKGIVN